LLSGQSWQEIQQKADSLSKKRAFKSAVPLFEEAAIIAEKEFGKESEKFLMSRNGFGRSIIYVWSNEKVEPILLENLAYCNKFNTKSAHYGHALNNLGTFYLPVLSGNKPKLSEIYLQQALKLRKELTGENDLDYCHSLNNLAVLYKETDRYDEALKRYKQVISIYKNIFGEKNPNYLTSLSNLAALYRVMGNYAESLPLNKQILEARKELFGESHPDYLASMNNLGINYMYMGNHETALLLYDKILQTFKTMAGENNNEYANALNSKGIVYIRMEAFDKALPYFEKSLVIRRELFGEEHPDYLVTLNNLALTHLALNNFAKANKLYSQAVEIAKTIFGEDSPKYAGILNNLAILKMKTNHFEEAEALNNQILSVYRAAYGTNHPNYIETLSNFANLNWGNHQRTKSFQQRVLIKNWAVEQINKQFPVLSEQQKEAFFYNNLQIFLRQYTTFSIETERADTKDFYNTLIATKGVLMQSTQKMKMRILSSKDTALIELFNSWMEKKNEIIQASEMSETQLKENGIDLFALTESIEKLENQLLKKSDAFKDITAKKTVSWQDIQKKLKSNEAAVEIVRIHKYGIEKTATDTSDTEKAPDFPVYSIYGETDTVYYAALIVKKKSKQPEIVLLKNGNDLEKKFINYQKNAILYRREDAVSYNEFWKPIADKLKGVQKVFFSPDGVYNQISLNTLQNPDTKRYVLDEIELHLVTNTKDLLSFGRSENKNLKAELLGYPFYDLKTQNASESRRRELEEDTTRAFTNFQKVGMLPGTKKEVEEISKILKLKNYALNILTEKNATEENIKKVQNPKILHISTHGFFIDGKEKNKNINPMLRSGLLLTGVSDYTRAEIKPETEDGVLTALEAANLELDGTDLVVLSACETGLGDVKGGEGVYGLQRAFKVAGAKTIVMSMWKVDDEVTQKLMITFYQKFAEYNNARKAFKEAQSEIKNQYPEPYFWGAFVMSGD
jgi:CHAT domain-containing protein